MSKFLTFVLALCQFALFSAFLNKGNFGNVGRNIHSSNRLSKFRVSLRSTTPLAPNTRQFPFGATHQLSASSTSSEVDPLSGKTISASSAAKREIVSNFRKKLGGKRTIQRILIANNGMAATKAIMSMRHWAYVNLGDEHVLEFVAMATREDLNANAEFIRLADSYVEVPSGSNKNNYANVDLIVKIAEEQHVDAVWPGWGHASENPRLPSSLSSRGIQFIGPTAPVMAALGDKVSANILAQTAKVPSIPWSGDGLTSGLNKDGVIPPEIFEKACVKTVEQAEAAAKRIGYPVMIKASEGGGGKGIRLAKTPEELKTFYVQVQNEVPGSPIFMMQLCTNARHLEVQIVGDEYGNAIAFNGRDCSTQRRFQKIFEEGPPIVAPKDVFKQMELSAQRLTQSIGYIGAGTVEYLYNANTNQYYFLELNPRLQVEHPVTEGITNTNLPSIQLQVAMGIPLHRIPDVRAFYGQDKDKDTPIDFMSASKSYVYPTKHVIAARITAENPDEGFKPTSGRIERVKFQSAPNVWGYFSVGANGGIHEFADSQFGHLFASGATREEARKALVLALKEVDIRGDIRTTVEYLIKLLETPEFKANTIDTSWLDGIIREKSVNVDVDPHLTALSAAIFRAYTHMQTAQAEITEALTRGQTSGVNAPLTQLLTFPLEVTFNGVVYPFKFTGLGPNRMRLEINGQQVDVRFRAQPDKSLLCTVNDQLNLQLFGQTEPLGLRMKINGQTVMIPTVYNPSELRADVTGKIVRYLHPDGAHIEKGENFVEVEAMKMIMSMKAPESGAITHTLSPGSIISAGDLMATLKLADPSRVKQLTRFQDALMCVPLPESAVSSSTSSESDRHVVDNAKEQLRLALEGFDVDAASQVQALQKAVAADSKQQPWSILSKELTPLIDHFVAIESLFVGQDENAAIASLAKKHKSDLLATVPTLLAHKQTASRSKALVHILREIHSWPDRFSGYTHDMLPAELKSALSKLSSLLLPSHGDDGTGATVSPVYSEVAFKAKQIMDASNIPPVSERIHTLTESIISALKSARDGDLYDLRELARQPEIAVNVDLLLTIMTTHADADVRKAALEVFLRRVYSSYHIHSLTVHDEAASKTRLSAEWEYSIKDTNVVHSSTNQASVLKKGVMVVVDGDVKTAVDVATKHATSFLPSSTTTSGNDLLVAVVDKTQSNEQDYSKQATEALASKADWLHAHGVKGASVFAPAGSTNKKSIYCNFEVPSKAAPVEIPGSRNMRPTSPRILELHRLYNEFDLTKLSNVGPNTHVYLGTAKDEEGKKESKGGKKAAKQQVLFLRSFSHHSDSATPGGASRLLEMALEELERATLDPRVSDTTPSRIFLHVLPTIGQTTKDTIKQFKTLMQSLIARYATRLLHLRVDEIEIKVRCAPESGVDATATDMGVPIRLVASSASGGWLSLEAFAEQVDPNTGHTATFHHLNIDSAKGAVDTESEIGAGVGVGGGVVRETANKLLNAKRLTARKVGSTYAPDFLALLEIALVNEWAAFREARLGSGKTAGTASTLEAPPNMLQSQELVLGADGELHKEKRLPGANKIGMLAWSVVMKTPAYPQGREVIVIANDVTVQSGSFGVQEDEFFFKASEYARVRGLPRVYIACNSGARIGLVEELKPKFQIAWKDDSNPVLGYEYLYLKPQDYEALPAGTVNAHKQVVKGKDGKEEARYVLDAIIGQEHGIGVENLRGSGLIAGETSRAYDETFTLSYVTGRSVGIGAYLNRLGQRIIQLNTGPMILTGYNALNKLLGKDVYTSQDQLGGPQVMYANGISHEVVNSDQDGAKAIIDWLSYVPENFKTEVSPAVTADTGAFIDPPDRPIGFMPTKTPYDPRHMLAGVTVSSGSGADTKPTYLSGFFDKGSFKEYMGGWGKSVVTGRARLGGINVGVIAVETRVVEQRIPADPGNPESREAIQPQAGQVWYPDSAFKTAQAIEDFNRGENLPLIILANWRGFSGGTRDMYGEILKFGAKIVDGLRNYKHPVFVYIPPNGELRGGAWVVVDPSINPDMMEMYADTQARGGILEPPGICEVKFRDVEQKETMHRLDPVLQELDKQLSASKSTPTNVESVQASIKAREKVLAPLYNSVAHEFADLHDRAGRMLAKGCIREILDWRSARSTLYWRLRRRLLQDEAARGLMAASPNLTFAAANAQLMAEAGSQVASSDRHMGDWLLTRTNSGKK